MAVLHNGVSQKELKEQLYREAEPRITISFYKYYPLDNPQEFRDQLYKGLNSLRVFGRIYVAAEGINAQASVPASGFAAFKEFLYSYSFLNGIRLNIAVDDDGKSFWVLKIKVRQKIVADGITDASFSMEKKGKYVNAKQMNQLLQDNNTIVVDMRNHYEYEVGHFVNAVEIASDTFREQLPMAVDILKDEKDKNIIMYCTGGIRCEKASAYMLHNGFNNVFHLEGGIINYAKEVESYKLESKFIGKNFVFDDRLGERITEDIISKCHQCGNLSDTHTNCKNDSCHLLFIQCEECAKKYGGCCSNNCQAVYNLPAEQQKILREGKQNGIMIFNKSRQRLRPKLNEEFVIISDSDM
jgi:UPF0176 protein